METWRGTVNQHLLPLHYLSTNERYAHLFIIYMCYSYSFITLVFFWFIGAAFVHGLHFPFSSFSWTHSNSDAVAISQPTSSHPWVIYRCKTCHSYIGATNSNSKVWSLKSAHLKRDPTTHLIKDFDKIKPTAHIFYKTRMLDVPDGLPKWDGYENQSNRLDMP